MILHQEIHKALNRIGNPKDRETVRKWLEGIEKDNKALTHGILSGIHKIPAPIKFPGLPVLLGLGAVVAPQVALTAGAVASAVTGGCSLLEWTVETLAAHSAKNGTLTDKTRKEIAQFFRYKHKHLPKTSKS